jgi:hypothetical protein
MQSDEEGQQKSRQLGERIVTLLAKEENGP